MILGIIPARYQSTRFPGKPLVDILGKTMIKRVYEGAVQSKSLDHLVVATDDPRIYDEVHSFNGNVMMTSPHHVTGTDRCYEVLRLLGGSYQYVINIQGDEPLIDGKQIDELASVLDGNTEVATQMTRLRETVELDDPSSVKIVVNKNMEALYFSRSPIPFMRGREKADWHRHHHYYRHTGMYAYRSDILEQINKLPVSSLEAAESLEQLRWLENGYQIKCVLTDYESIPVDEPGDVEKLILRLKNK